MSKRIKNYLEVLIGLIILSLVIVFVDALPTTDSFIVLGLVTVVAILLYEITSLVKERT